MSNSNIFLKSVFPRAPLQNGMGRYVPQLQRITIKYCKSSGASKGVRDFLENQLLNFSTHNPSVVVYVKPRRHRGPVLVAEYLNGGKHWKSVAGLDEENISKWIDLMRTQNHNSSETRMIKHWHTDMPSIQGVWTPFTHLNPDVNVAKFPDAKYSEPINLEPTATDKMLEIFAQQKQNKKLIKTDAARSDDANIEVHSK